MIDARHCNAQDVSTCKGPWPTITVGNLPNGATCNGTNHSGCGRTPATASAGFGSVSVALDPATGRVYVANIEDTSVTVINGATCNGTDTTGCGQAHPKVAVGNYPGATTIDPASGTAYISNSDNTLSVIHG